MTERIKVATYNIHGAVGTDGRADLDRVAEVIGELGADLVGLQEVDSRGWRTDVPGPLERLSDVTGMTAVAAPTIEGREGNYGNAVLTRLTVAEVRRHDLSVPGREPRGAVWVRVGLASGRWLDAAVTHLGLRRRERLLQVMRLLPLIDAGGDSPLVLLGDFNEGSWREPSLRELTRRFGRTPRPRSFPSRLALFSLDRIWVRPRRLLREVAVHASPLARRASDHLPVTATLEVGDGGTTTGGDSRGETGEGRRGASDRRSDEGYPAT